MKDYAKLVNTTPREIREAQKVQPQEQPNLVRSAKELQPKENQGNKNMLGILLIIFILIAVGYGVVRQYLATHHINLSNGKITNEIAQIKKSTSSNQNSVPQFDFYTVLPKGATPATAPNTSTQSATPASTPAANTTETTTSTPATAAPATTTTTPPQPVAAPPSPPPAAPVTTINVSSNKYYLNIGDYNTNDDAQKMLSQLLLLGVQASIMPKDDNGASVYEVLVGPFSDQDTMSVVKNQLNSHQINSMVIQ